MIAYWFRAMLFHSQDQYGSANFVHFYNAIAIESGPREAAVCKLLDITVTTLRHYLAGKRTPPKAFVRLIYMECSYGRAVVAGHEQYGQDLHRRAYQSSKEYSMQQAARITALESENDALRRGTPDAVAANQSYANGAGVKRRAGAPRSYDY